MLVHRINELSAFAMMGGVADILNLLRALELPESDLQIMEEARRRLQDILDDEGAHENRDLADVAYATLLTLAELYPIDDIDPITQENIHPDDAVYISTGRQFDIYQLINYQHVRNYRGGALGELPDSKALLNPMTNELFSPRDSAHIQDVAVAKRIHIRDLKEGQDQEYTALAQYGFFEYIFPKCSPGGYSSDEEVKKANHYYQKYFRAVSQDERDFSDENKNTIKSFIGFFEHPKFHEIGFPDYLTVDDLYHLAGFHYSIMEFFTPGLQRALERNVITPAQFCNNENGEFLFELIKPSCLEALEVRDTCYDLLTKFSAQELREANRANEYPPLMPGLLEVEDTVLTQLIHKYSAVEELLEVGVTLEMLQSVGQSRRDMLLSNSFMIVRFSKAGISAAYFMEHDVDEINAHLKIGTPLALILLCEDINVQPGYLASLSPEELGYLGRNSEEEEVRASIPRAQPGNFSP